MSLSSPENGRSNSSALPTTRIGEIEFVVAENNNGGSLPENPKPTANSDSITDKVGLAILATAVAFGTTFALEKSGEKQIPIQVSGQTDYPHTLQLPENPRVHSPEEIVIVKSPQELQIPEKPAENPSTLIFKQETPGSTYSFREARYTFQLPVQAKEDLAEYAEGQGLSPEDATMVSTAMALPDGEFWNEEHDALNPKLAKACETLRKRDPQTAKKLAELHLDWIGSDQKALRHFLLVNFLDPSLNPQAMEKYRQALKDALEKQKIAENQAQAIAEAAQTATQANMLPAIAPENPSQPQPQSQTQLLNEATNKETAQTAIETTIEPTVEAQKATKPTRLPEIKFSLGWSPIAVAQFIEGMENLAGLTADIKEKDLPVYTVISCQPLAPGVDACFLAGLEDNQKFTFIVLPAGLAREGTLLTYQSLVDLVLEYFGLLKQ